MKNFKKVEKGRKNEKGLSFKKSLRFTEDTVATEEKLPGKVFSSLRDHCVLGLYSVIF